MQNNLSILFLVLLAISCIEIVPPNEEGDNLDTQKNTSTAIIDSTLTDPRDGQTYRIRKFGQLWWMIDNINFDMGDNFFYEEDYVGLGSYCPTDDCSETGSYYGSSAAIKVCPDGWRLPTLEEWATLNDNHANCTWDNNSPTANIRDTMPTYEINLNSKGNIYTAYLKQNEVKFQTHLHNIEEDFNIRFWCTPNDRHLNYFVVNSKYCKASKHGKTIYKSKGLEFKGLLPCRCVQEAN